MFIISHSTDHLESSMGAATALYSATCLSQGKYGNGNPYPINLRAIVGLSGWLPGSRPNWEGGQYDGDEKSRLNVLQLPMELGADYIDVELQLKNASSEKEEAEWKYYYSISFMHPVRELKERYQQQAEGLEYKTTRSGNLATVEVYIDGIQVGTAQNQ